MEAEEEHNKEKNDEDKKRFEQIEKTKRIEQQKCNKFLESTNLNILFSNVFTSLIKINPFPKNPIQYVLDYYGYDVPKEEETEQIRQDIKKLKIKLITKQEEIDSQLSYLEEPPLLMKYRNKESKMENNDSNNPSSTSSLSSPSLLLTTNSKSDLLDCESRK